MSVPLSTASLNWSDAGSLLRESDSVDRSGLASQPPGDSPVPAGAAVAVVSVTEVASDSELLQAFIASKPGEAAAQMALTRIVERHGAMVYQVALRLVNDRNLADDLFQATFLVLAQSARKIQRSGSLASWLHGTARNIGRRALAQKHAERSGTATGVEMVTAVEDDPFHEMMRSHERQLLDEELQQLPELHRAPLVLFYLEERSQLEISQMLGITVPAVESRLKRAKQELRGRMVRRGITLSVALAAVGWGASVASAAPPAALVTSTISLAASGAAVGTSLTAGGSVAIQLAGKELAAMSAASKVSALIVGAAGTLTVGGAVLFGAMAGGEPGSGQSPGAGPPSAVIGTETGLGEFEEPQTILLAQAEEAEPPKDDAQAPAPEAKEATEAPPVPVDEAFLRQNTQELVGREPTEVEVAAFLQNSHPGKRRKLVARLKNEARIRAEGPFVAKYRQLSDRDREIYEALEMETALEFPDNTLREVMEFISQHHGISFSLDHQALTDAGLDEETRINLAVSGITLNSAMSLMLDNVSGTALDYYVENGMMFVTTAEKANAKVRLRFYDLLEASDKSGIENLTHAVAEYVEKLSEDSGQSVQVTSLSDSLAVRATLETHKQIEEFIAGALQLAEARRASGRPLPVVPERPTTTEPMQPAAQVGSGGGFF